MRHFICFVISACKVFNNNIFNLSCNSGPGSKNTASLGQVKNYRGKGIAANLFYEAKVAEALSLIVERDRTLKKKPGNRKTLSAQDIRLLENLALYLNDHCMQELPLEQIAQIACMGVRKIQTSFKEFYGCTITEYIQQRRMSQAENLLANTELPIGQVAQTAGYTNASRFVELFRKSTGLLPGEFRKIVYNKRLISPLPQNRHTDS